MGSQQSWPILTTIRGGAYDVHLNRLQVIQNDALRIAFGIQRDRSVKHIFIRFKLLNIRACYYYNLSILAFKNIKKQLPNNSGFTFIPNQNPHSLRNPRIFNGELGLVGCRKRSSVFRTPTLWQNLDSDLISTESLAVFKKRLMTWILNKQEKGLRLNFLIIFFVLQIVSLYSPNYKLSIYFYLFIENAVIYLTGVYLNKLQLTITIMINK